MENSNSIVKSAYEKAVEKTENMKPEPSAEEQDVQDVPAEDVPEEEPNYEVLSIMEKKKALKIKRLRRLKLYKTKKNAAHTRKRRSIAKKSRKRNS